MTIKKAIPDYFPALTGVRAIAAYMVFFHHYNPFASDSQKLFHDFIGEFHIGVTIFFVLSGFLITYRYYGKQFTFRSYMKNRIARIYPMFFILTTLGFMVPLLVTGITSKETFTAYLLNITFLKGFFNDIKFSGIPQSWSLTVEEVFYLCAPIFFLIVAKNIRMIIILPCIILIFGILLVFIFKDISLYGFYSSFGFMINYTFTGRCFEFFIGMGLALLIKREIHFKFRYFTYLGLMMMIVCIFGISLFKGSGDYGIRHPAGVFLNTILLPLSGIAILFYGLIREESLLKNILSNSLFQLAGKSSYIFYLIQMGVVYNLIFAFVTEINWIIFIILILLSHLIFHFMEEPLNKIIRKI